MIDTLQPLAVTQLSAAPKQTQPVKETAKALAAFDAYCALGVERSLAKLAKAPETFGKTSVSVRQLEYWSSMHNWVVRAAVFDRHQAELRRRQQEQELERMLDIERLARGASTELSKLEIAGDPERPLIIKTVWDKALLTIPQENTRAPGRPG